MNAAALAATPVNLVKSSVVRLAQLVEHIFHLILCGTVASAGLVYAYALFHAGRPLSVVILVAATTPLWYIGSTWIHDERVQRERKGVEPVRHISATD